MADNPHKAFITRLFRAIDTKDTDKFIDCVTPSASFRFGSSPAVSGHEQIRAAVGGFFTMVDGLAHSVNRTLTDGNVLVCEGEVCYRRYDGSEITVPFTNVFEFDGDRVADYRIYIDNAPLFAA